MTSKKLWVLQGAAIALAFAFALPAHATVITFTIDETGTGDVSSPAGIAPSGANVGKYNAGSYLALSGNVAGSLSGTAFSGNFAAQKAASGVFSTGNPGSLTAFYTGTLLADVNVGSTAITFVGGSTANSANYNAKYPIVGGPDVPLSPAIGGGTSTTTPGSDPANYGVSLKIGALGGLITVANGTSALRNTVIDVISVPNIPLGAPVSGVQTFTSKTNVSAAITSANFDFNLKGSVVLGNTVPDLIGTSPITATGPVTGAQSGSLKTVVVDPVRQIYNYYLTVPLTNTTQQTVTGSVPVTITVTTTGQVAAYALNVQIPEPATFVLAGFAAVPLGLMAWRRRKRR